MYIWFYLSRFQKKQENNLWYKTPVNTFQRNYWLGGKGGT